MEQRNNRPYLLRSDEVDKFLRKQRLPSPYRRSGTIANNNKFPTTDNELDRKYTTSVSEYNTNNNASSASGGYPTVSLGNIKNGYPTSVRYGRLPTTLPRTTILHNHAPISRITNNLTTSNGYGGRDMVVGNIGQRLEVGNYSRQQEQRIIPIQFNDEEAKKSKSALKSLRSFFKKHLGFSNTKRDYSAGPISRRFSSTQHINGRIPSSSTFPSASDYHRRSNSISASGSSTMPRPQTFGTSGRSRIGERQIPITANAVAPLSPPSDDDQTEQHPSFRNLMDRFSNISIGEHPKLSSMSVQQAPTKPLPKLPLSSSSSNAAAAVLPPTPSLTRRPSYQSTSIGQPRPATSNATISSSAQLLEKEPKKTSSLIAATPCLKGLANHGNTCYFSAILQCLSCCDRFAKYFVCNELEELNTTNPLLANALGTTLRGLWYNHYSADSSCLKLLQLVAKTNPHFTLSHQQDAHECLIWLLDRLHEEIKEDESGSRVKSINNGTSLRSHKSESELAIDALERVSGSNRSSVMDLFRAQFRSAMECTNPVCGFTNLTFDPYLSVSLSVPLPKRPREFSVVFIPFFDSRRQIVRYHFQLSDSISTVWHIKERIMQKVRGSADQTIACQIQSNGQCNFLADGAHIGDRMKEITLLEVPKLNEQQMMQDLVIATVVFVLGIVPDGERYGYPYVAVLNRLWGYDRISSFLLEKCSFLLPRAFHPLPSDYTLLIQHSAESVACLDSMMAHPLFHDSVNKVLYGKQPGEGVLKLIVEWNSSMRHEFARAPTEAVATDCSFLADRLSSGIALSSTDEIPIPLVSLIEDYVKRESIQDWKCPKCEKSPGVKELKFHSLPDVLIFHLKRFDLLNDGVTNKIDTRVQIPLDSLDMSPYAYNPDVRASTLPKHRRDRNLDYLQEDSMLYDLVGVVNHFGQRTNSGHYTATTRNPMDQEWRVFDDSRVSQPLGLCDIRVSNKSYLLFYERRSSRNLSPGDWFPKSVPGPIAAKYSDEGIVRAGSSKFYTSAPTAVENAERAEGTRTAIANGNSELPTRSQGLMSSSLHSALRPSTAASDLRRAEPPSAAHVRPIFTSTGARPTATNHHPSFPVRSSTNSSSRLAAEYQPPRYSHNYKY